MIETSIIVFGVVVSLLILSKADVKITITHTSEPPKITPTTQGMTQDELDDKVEKQDRPPTFDDVVSAVHEILGGDADD